MYIKEKVFTMSNNKVPSLSPSGWVSAVAEKIDLLLSHFYEAYQNQTYVYKDKITSLQYLIEEHGKDIPALQSKVRGALSLYLTRHFDTANVEVTVTTDESTNESTINIYATVTQNGVEYNVAKLISIAGNTIKSIVDANNA